MWPILVLLSLSLVSTSAQGQLRTETVETQSPAVPPLSPHANTSSLRLWPARAAKIVSTKVDGHGTVYEHSARHDAFGFRIADGPRTATARSHHLFLSGCSFTYGFGLAVEQTFFGQLSERLTDHSVVNMAVGGGSLAEALYLWKNFEWQQTYPEETGVFLFTLIPAHHGRLTRNWGYLSWANENAPAFDDELRTSRPSHELWDQRVAQTVNRLGLTYWWLRLTSHFVDRDPETFTALMVRYLRALKAEYLRRYPRGRFVLTWMNFQLPTFAPRDLPKFLTALEHAGVEYWAPAPTLSRPPGEYRIPRDAHPSAHAHREHAEFLLTRIGHSRK